MPAILNEQQHYSEPLKEDYTGWYVTRALRRLLRRLNAEMGTKCTDAEINIMAYLIYKGMAECRSKDWFLQDLKRAMEDENYDPRYGWVSTSANQLSDPDRAGVVFCSESKTGELLNKLIAMGILERVEDPVNKRYFFYRIDYIFIAEAMRDAGESFLLPRVYDEENVNLTALLLVWENEQEDVVQPELVDDEDDQADNNSAADVRNGTSEELYDNAQTAQEKADIETVSTRDWGTDDTLSAVQDEIEAAAVEVASIVDKPCSTKVDSDIELGSPEYGDNIDLKDCNINITQTPPTETPNLILYTTPHPVVLFADRFHDVFRYVPGRKNGIKAAIRDLLRQETTPDMFDAAFNYAQWVIKRPGNIENPVGWFKTCVQRKFWETDAEYQNRGRSVGRNVGGQEKPSWLNDGQKKLSAEEFRAGIARMFREAGVKRERFRSQKESTCWEDAVYDPRE